MRLINTNLLNYFYKNGIKPLKTSLQTVTNNLSKKLDASKVSNNLTTNQAGFALDARQGPVIQKEINDLETSVSEINSNFSWKHFGLFTTATGQLPDDFEEILVWVSCGVAYNFTFYFKYFMLFESANYFRTGHYNSQTDCSGCTISITKKQFSTIVFIDQKAEQNIRINVYYR